LVSISRDEVGQVATLTGDDNLQAKILEVVLTSPGERVNLPDFGCGLRDLVFDPNNDVLAATTEFAINKSLAAMAGQRHHRKQCGRFKRRQRVTDCDRLHAAR